MSDFASILAAIDPDHSLEINPEKTGFVSAQPQDQLNLSIQGQKALPAVKTASPETLRQPETRTDRQGNKTGFSSRSRELACAQSERVVWETVTKIPTDLPEIKPGKQKLAKLLKAGILRDNNSH